jgi:tRNA uridine 5-carboxymethylaminomethyl modification enzyme
LLSSRAEYRLLLRHDNADLRLSEIGHDIGLINDDRYKRFKKKSEDLRLVLSILTANNIKMNAKIEQAMIERNSPPFTGAISGLELLRRPEINYRDLLEWMPKLKEISLDDTAISQLEINVKFEGYIQKQIRQAERQQKQESIRLPTDLNYLSLDGLAVEARQRLNKIKPLTIGQASRISGVNPSDIAMLVLYLRKGH